MNYNELRYIYPPRPESKINPDNISLYDTQEYVAQPKYNGSCSVVFMKENFVTISNRHNEEKTKTDNIDFPSCYRGAGWMVLTGELMDKSKLGEDGSKLTGFIIWDILVYESNYLIGSTLYERLMLLEKLYPSRRQMFIGGSGILEVKHLQSTDHAGIYKAATYFGGQSYFKELYRDIVKTDVYEGLVMKKLLSKLEFGWQSSNNTGWQIKARKPTKNYKI